MATTSHWLAQPLPPVPAGSRSGRVDVAVVGGGVTGCACALELAHRGARVRLCEAGIVAGGASGRNAGFALRGGVPGYAEARRALGAERARLLWALSERALDRIAELAGDAFHRVGSVQLAADDAELAALGRDGEALRGDGFAVEWEGSLAPPLGRLFLGGLVHPGDGTLDPARWVRLLAGRAAAAGAEICERFPVSAGELGRLDAAAVVVAVDAGTAALLPELAATAVPVRGQMLVTEPVPGGGAERPCYARGGFDYWRFLADGRLVLGGRRDAALAREYTGTDATTRAVQGELDALTAELTGAPAAVERRWAGLWGETPDRLPLAGRVPGRDGVWVAGGYSGHGNVLGLACGELVARALAGDDPPELELFDPARLLPSLGARAPGNAPPGWQLGHQ